MALPVTDITQRLVGPLALYDNVMRRVLARTSASTSMTEQRAIFYQAVWRDAADSVGASVRELGGRMLEIGRDGVTIRVRDNLTSLDDPVTLALAGDKPAVYRLLSAAGLPVPRHLVCRLDQLDQARTFAESLGAPCVVKPAIDSAAGAGVTTGVTGERPLARAMARAAAWSHQITIEEQVSGGNYRLLYLDGELLDAVLRRPPTVRGDGKSTIAQLVKVENAARVRGGMDAAQTVIRVDHDLRNTLRRQGLEMRSVPRAGEAVQVKTVVNDNRREDNEAALDAVCPALAEAGAAAAVAVGARLAGVDVITGDPSVPLEESGGVVLEVNTTPGHHYHYKKRDGGTRVARMILERLLGAHPG